MIARAVPFRLRPQLARRRTASDRTIALLLFVAALGLFCTTMGRLTGYEPETAGVAEGIVKVGAPRLVPGSPIDAGQPAVRGRYSRTGLTQPLLEVPFYWLGERLDDAASGGRSYKWRDALLRFYNPTMAAVAVLAIFSLLRLRGRNQRQALAIAGLAAVGSMIWPYSKIGMETTMMAMVALMLVGAAWATAHPAPEKFALTGLAAGATAASKPIGIVLLLGLLAFAGPIMAIPRPARIRLLLAFALPLVVWLAAILWYNAYRTGSITDVGQPFDADWFGAPWAAIGMLISPGKGLLWFSPLVILGAIALPRLWREDRTLMLAVLLTFAANLIVISASKDWAEETWGPRYLVPTAWLLLLSLAWWDMSAFRRRLLGTVAVIAVLVQFVGVFSWYGVSVTFARAFSGEPVYQHGPAGSPIAYGNDAPTWIPGLSEVRLQGELLAAWLKEGVTGTGFKITYGPFWGRQETANLTHPATFVGAPLPDFWWNYPGRTTALDAAAIVLGLAWIGSSAALVRVAWRPRLAAMSIVGE